MRPRRPHSYTGYAMTTTHLERLRHYGTILGALAALSGVGVTVWKTSQEAKAARAGAGKSYEVLNERLIATEAELRLLREAWLARAAAEAPPLAAAAPAAGDAGRAADGRTVDLRTRKSARRPSSARRADLAPLSERSELSLAPPSPVQDSHVGAAADAADTEPVRWDKLLSKARTTRKGEVPGSLDALLAE